MNGAADWKGGTTAVRSSLRASFEDRARLILRSSVLGQLVSVLIGLLLVFVLWARVPHPLLWSWLAGLVAIAAVRAALMFVCRRRLLGGISLAGGLLFYGVGGTLSALWWGSAIYWFDNSDLVTAVIVAFTLGGMALGGLAVLGAMLRLYVPYLLAILLPITLHFLVLRNEAGMAGLGVMLVAFIGALIALATLLRNTLIRTFTLAKSLDAAKRRAEDDSRAKSEFLAYISHEIRTPMNGVLGMTEILLESPLDTDQRHLATTILQSGKSLLAVINDVLDISKIEAGKLALELRPFDPALVVQAQADLFAELAHRKQLELQIELAPDLPRRVLGDQQRFGQIIANLISNALKFTPSGHVCVRLTAAPIVGDAGSVWLELVVADSGIGIAPAALERIFDIFEQGDVSTARRFGGTGLGLAICKKLATLMGGTIDVKSEPARGTCFTVRIRARHVEEVARDGSGSEGGAQTSAPLAARVLVAEDNAVNQELIRRMLDALGCSVHIVDNGAEALEQARTQHWDVILMDSDMPEMTGIEATHRIREVERAMNIAPVPIIAVTANALLEDRQRYLEIGMNDYLIKPFSKQQLRELLSAYAVVSRPHDIPVAGA